MKQILRLLIIPAVLVLLAAALLLFGVFSIESELPLENIARIAAVVAALLLSGILAFEVRALVKSWQLPEPEDPPQSDRVIEPKPLDDTFDALHEAEQFGQRAAERVLIDIDIEDARDD